jgi:hypothetical protein
MRQLLFTWVALLAFFFTTLEGIHAQLAAPQHADELPPLCSGDLFQYRIFEPGINYWEWSLSPEWAIPVTQTTGPNGFQILSQLYNPTGLPIEITGVFIGYRIGIPDVLVKKINFWVLPRLSCAIDQDISFDVSNDGPVKEKISRPENNFTGQTIENRTSSYSQSALRVYPMPATDKAIVEWHQLVELPMTLFIFNLEGTKVSEYVIANHNAYSEEIDVSQLTTGMYIIQLISGNQNHNVPLIKI